MESKKMTPRPAEMIGSVVMFGLSTTRGRIWKIDRVTDLEDGVALLEVVRVSRSNILQVRKIIFDTRRKENLIYNEDGSILSLPYRKTFANLFIAKKSSDEILAFGA